MSMATLAYHPRLSEGMPTLYSVHKFLETTAIDGEHLLLL